MGHVNKKHTDNEIPQRTSKTRATKPAAIVQNVTMASKPADIEDKLKCKVCLTKCSSEEVLKKHLKRGHKNSTAKIATPAPNKNVWKVTSNLSTKDVNNLLEDEEEIREEVEKLKHDVGINDSAGEWLGVNFGSTFSNSGEFEGRNASTFTGRNKCHDCEVNSKTIEKQINLLTNQDKQLQDSHKIQRDEKKSVRELKKRLDDTVKLVEELTNKNINVQNDLQVQKDLVVALKLQLSDNSRVNQETEGPFKFFGQQCDNCVFVSKDRVLMQYHKKSHHVISGGKVLPASKKKTTDEEEGPLPEGERKCDQCNYENKNRVLMQAHKLKRHKEEDHFKCRMCAVIYPTKVSFEKHMKQHKAELDVGRTSQCPLNVYSFICKPCDLSFKTHDDLMDHMCLVHLPKRNEKVQHASTQEKPAQTSRPPLCKNGPQCRFHREFRCSFFHPQPPQEQQRQWQEQPRQPRQPCQSPTNQWQEVVSWWPHHQGHKYQQTPQQESHRYGRSTWCQHEENCLQGRFCVLRQEEGFNRWSPDRRY